MKFLKMDTLPAWKQGVLNEQGLMPRDPEGVPVWSGKMPPPAIGERVNVRINSLGAATVVGYFTEGGYLGLRVQHDNPPAWYLKQNGGNVPGCVFGIEIGPIDA
jgi:hypothetical protein